MHEIEELLGARSDRGRPWLRVGCLLACIVFLWCGACVRSTVGVGDASGMHDVTADDDASGADSTVDVAFDDDTVAQDASEREPVDAGLGPPYPVIFHHGFAGFQNIGPVNYFFNVVRDLRARGEYVIESEVSPFNSSTVRAGELARIVDRLLSDTRRARVVIIAHSQGGIDARHLISRMGYGDRVALLATIATPHRGTRIGDAALGTIPGVPDFVLNGFAALLGFSYSEIRTNPNVRASLESLSERSMSQFNRDAPDDPRVVYWSWTGRSNRRTGETACAGSVIANDSSRVDDAMALLIPTALWLERGDPALHVNDGLVEVQSARWGTFMGCVPADHWDEIGQIAHTGPVFGSGFDHLVFYRDVVRRIRDAGL